MDSEIEVKEYSSGIEKWAPWFAVLWILCAMNSIFAWFSFSIILRAIAATGVVLASMSMDDRVVTRQRVRIAFLTFVFYLWVVIKYDTLGAYVFIATIFVPFMCIVFWSGDQLKRMYELFRKVVIFFAIGSSILTVLSYVGITSYIPHFEIGPQSPLHENRNDYYYVYGIFPEINGVDIFFHRACGMMEEPGHFSIVLGFVYMIDRYTCRKINPIIIICAILAFSSAFFLMMLFTEFWNMIVYWRKTLLYLLCAITLGVIIYRALPTDMQDMVYHLSYERNLEQVVDAFEKSGSLDEALDERANDMGKNVFDRMSFDQKLVGGEGGQFIVLSDYRGFIVTMGYIGFWIVILISILTLSGSPFLLKVSLSLSLLLIMLHRSWFFNEPFPYFMSFMACALYQHIYFEKDNIEESAEWQKV